MCQFFSFLSDAKGNYYYADWELRKKHLKGKCKGMVSPDSHSSLARHFLTNGAEDHLNAYEFSPLTGVFTKDKLNTEDDSASAEKWAREIDWKRIVEPMEIKPIVHPFRLPKRKPTRADITLLKKWASVWASVGASVRDSVWASVWDSVGAYISNFFPGVKFYHDFSPTIKLWERGLVPSFDGKMWRLHSGEKAEVVYEWTPQTEEKP